MASLNLNDVAALDEPGGVLVGRSFGPFPSDEGGTVSGSSASSGEFGLVGADRLDLSGLASLGRSLAGLSGTVYERGTRALTAVAAATSTGMTSASREAYEPRRMAGCRRARSF